MSWYSCYILSHSLAPSLCRLWKVCIRQVKTMPPGRPTTLQNISRGSTLSRVNFPWWTQLSWVCSVQTRWRMWMRPQLVMLWRTRIAAEGHQNEMKKWTLTSSFYRVVGAARVCSLFCLKIRSGYRHCGLYLWHKMKLCLLHFFFFSFLHNAKNCRIIWRLVKSVESVCFLEEGKKSQAEHSFGQHVHYLM